MGAMVKIKLVYHPGRNMPYIKRFVFYLRKVGKGPDGGESPHFTRAGEAVKLEAFFERIRGDGWCFQVVLGPDPARAPDLPLQRYAQAWMLAVDQYLGRKVDWVGAVHYDTPDHLHVQFLWAGQDLAGRTLRLHRETVSHTLRALAEKVEAWY